MIDQLHCGATLSVILPHPRTAIKYFFSGPMSTDARSSLLTLVRGLEARGSVLLLLLRNGLGRTLVMLVLLGLILVLGRIALLLVLV